MMSSSAILQRAAYRVGYSLTIYRPQAVTLSQNRSTRISLRRRLILKSPQTYDSKQESTVQKTYLNR